MISFEIFSTFLTSVFPLLFFFMATQSHIIKTLYDTFTYISLVYKTKLSTIHLYTPAKETYTFTYTMKKHIIIT